MSKTIFDDGNPSLGVLGTRVLAAWLNKVFSHRHTGQDEDGSAPLDYSIDYSNGVVPNMYMLDFALPLTAHTPGLPIYFKAAYTNTGPSTLAITSIGGAPPAITKSGGAALAAGDIVAGQLCLVVWDGARYQLLSTGFTKSLADQLYAPATILQTAYPVGSLYFNASNATSPAALFGFGTWVAFGAGRMLLGAGGGYAVGATGGAVTHTLTANEMPAHNHTGPTFRNLLKQPYAGSLTGSDATNSGAEQAVGAGDSGEMVNAGGGGAHNNMPPYIAVYIWQRTA